MSPQLERPSRSKQWSTSSQGLKQREESEVNPWCSTEPMLMSLLSKVIWWDEKWKQYLTISTKCLIFSFVKMTKTSENIDLLNQPVYSMVPKTQCGLTKTIQETNIIILILYNADRQTASWSTLAPFNLIYTQLKGATFSWKREVKCIHKFSTILGLTNICERFID